MLTQICHYLKNWFDYNQKKYFGDFTISEGVISYAGGEIEVQNHQYYRIVGSVFNDGVHQRGSEKLTDESFSGALWLMAVPPDVIDLASDIAEWEAKYSDIDSQNMSPYQSESFGGYSYSKASGGNADKTGSSVPTWESIFGARLRRYRKI